MKNSLLVLSLLAMIASVAGAPIVEAAPPSGSGIALAVHFDCDGLCAEPFFTPALRFKVLEGTWPEKGQIITGCKSVGRRLNCANGLSLEIVTVIFK